MTELGKFLMYMVLLAVMIIAGFLITSIWIKNMPPIKVQIVPMRYHAEGV